MEQLFDSIPQRFRPGNVVSVPVLRRFGVTKVQQRALTRTGVLIPIRKGWLAGPSPHVDILRAIRSGGVLGCSSALTLYGGWDPKDAKLHTYRTDWGRRHPPGRIGWCPSPKSRAALDVALTPMSLAISQAIHCLPAEDLLAQVESLIYEGRLSRIVAEQLLGDLAADLDISESGTETKARYRLRKLGLKVQPQVHIRGVGRVDLLIGERLVMEIDSTSYHSDRKAFQQDRIRDMRLTRMGFRVIRVTWQQVMYDWAEVEDSVLALVRSRAHLDRSRKRF